MWGKKSSLLVASLLIVVTISGCLGSDNGGGDDTNPPPNVEEDVALWDYALKNATYHLGEYYSFIGEYAYEAEEGKIFYVVEIRIVNNGDVTVDINAFYWELQADGLSYQVDSVTFSDYIDYDTGTSVLPGGTLTFELCYEIPTGISGWSVVYDGWVDMERDDSLL